jgi:hypothetical protein
VLCPLWAKSGHWSPSLDHLVGAGILLRGLGREVRPTSPWIGNDLLKGLHSAFAMYASVRVFAHVTKAAEFQARALCEANEMTRLHFDNLAKDYLQLAELAAQIDNLRAAQDRRFR